MIAVSIRFETMDRIERYNAVYDLWDGPVDIEPIALTPAEFDRSAAGTGIVAMALDGGVVDLA